MRSDSEMVNLRSVVEILCYMVDDDSDGVEEIMQLPTIDLVRCKECMHHFDNYCPKIDSLTEDTFHCGWGERGDNE